MTKHPLSPLLLLVAVLLVTSCNPTVQFEEPMPPGRFNLPNIPRAFRGEIVDGDEVTRIGKDSIWMDDEVMVNGQDFLLRRMAGHLVMSQPVAETGHWEVFVVKREGDQFRLGYFNDDKRTLRRMTTLLEVPLEKARAEGTPGYGYVLLSPSSKEFKAILKQGLYEAGEETVPLPRGGVVKP